MNQQQPSLETMIANKVAAAVTAQIAPLLRDLEAALIRQPQSVKPNAQYMSLKQLGVYFGYGYGAMRRISQAAGFPKQMQAPSGEDGASTTQPRWKLSEVEKYFERISK